MTRCFVAFELSEDSRAYLAEQVTPLHRRLREELGWPVRLIRAENWHATVLFFDDLDAAQRDAVWAPVEAGVAAGAWGAPAFDWRGLALWPSPRRPALLCLEAAEYPAAAGWPVAPLLADEPFVRADLRHYHRFTPHITLMRFQHRRHGPLGRQWADVAASLPALSPARIRFDRISFILSTLSPAQPIYPRERLLPLP